MVASSAPEPALCEVLVLQGLSASSFAPPSNACPPSCRLTPGRYQTRWYLLGRITGPELSAPGRERALRILRCTPTPGLSPL